VDFEEAKGAATNPADFELSFRMGRSRKTPIAGQTIKPTAMPGLSATARPAVPAAAPLGANPLGTGQRLPPLATSPSGHGAVTSPNPLQSDSVFGSGFESLFGQ
jgi:twitching motility protein PilT